MNYFWYYIRLTVAAKQVREEEEEEEKIQVSTLSLPALSAADSSGFTSGHPHVVVALALFFGE